MICWNIKGKQNVCEYIKIFQSSLNLIWNKKMQIHISKNEKKYVASSFLQDRNLYPELEQLEEKKKNTII